MPLQLTVWLVPSLLGAAISLAVAAYAYGRRTMPGAVPMACIALLAAGWALAQALEIGLSTPGAKLWAVKLQFSTTSFAALAWLWFAIDFTRPEWSLGRRAIAALLIVPVLTVLLALTNEWHGLVWSRFAPSEGPMPTGRDHELGVWFEVFRFYSWGVAAIATGMLAWYLAQTRHHRRRIAGVVAAPVVVIALSLAYQSRLQPPEWVNLTPLGLAVALAIISWTLLRSRLLDLPPVARARVLDQLVEGVLVTDSRGRILDLNPAAEELLGLTAGAELPQTIREVLGGLARGEVVGTGSLPVEHDTGGGPRRLEVRIAPWERHGGSDRFVLVLRDTTERDGMERDLRAANLELSRMNAELERLARTDTLTALANRGHLMEALGTEMQRAARHERPLALLILDLDHFKEVNDRFGHPAGDAVLQATAGHIQAVLRATDLAARLGGEEFAVLLPETDLDGGAALAERIRARIEEQRFTSPDGTVFWVTASVGAAERREGMSLGELVQAADAAMYRSKDAGRNRVTLALGEATPRG